MRYYLVDDIPEDKLAALSRHLSDQGAGAGLPDLFWLDVPQEFLSPVQQEHVATCGPYVMALEIEDNAVRLELLIRSRTRLRCDCVQYADAAPLNAMISRVNKLLEDFGILN